MIVWFAKEAGPMGRINMGRVILGGIVPDIVVNILGFAGRPVLTTIPRSVSQQVPVKHALLVMFYASAGNVVFWAF